jgi:hypothetical protein
MRLAADGVVRDSGLPDPTFASAFQHAVEDLPADTLIYLLGSRYCETDRLSEIAWKLFEKTRRAGHGSRPQARLATVPSARGTWIRSVVSAIQTRSGRLWSNLQREEIAGHTHRERSPSQSC